MLYAVIILFDLGEPLIFRSCSLHHRIIAMDCIARSSLRSVIVCFAWGLDCLSLARLRPPAAQQAAGLPLRCHWACFGAPWFLLPAGYLFWGSRTGAPCGARGMSQLNESTAATQERGLGICWLLID